MMLRTTKTTEKGKETIPPWRTSSAAAQEAKRVLQEKKQEQQQKAENAESEPQAIKVKALRNSLSIAVAGEELPRDGSSDEDTTSSEDFQPAQEGQEIVSVTKEPEEVPKKP